MTNAFIRNLSPDWRDLIAASITRSRNLPDHLSPGTQWSESIDAFPMKINPYLLSMIRSADDPLGRQFLPHPTEGEDIDRSSDPLSEETQSPAPQVVHRYPHRVLLLVSNLCAVHCRFCMRKRRVTGLEQVDPALIRQGIDYIRGNHQINEVILSGGDPLMLSDRRLVAILQDLRRIPHVGVIRIHTRMPGVCPQRVTEALVRRLRAFQPLYIIIHANHPLEITPASAAACRRLADAGIPLGSQTVLLRGVNDDVEVLHGLMQTLLINRIRPYYIHQVDRVPGTRHFQVPIQRALQLMDALRGRLSGLAMPHFTIDLPGGGGKVALTPDVVVASHDTAWQVRNWEGRIYPYPCG